MLFFSCKGLDREVNLIVMQLVLFRLMGSGSSGTAPAGNCSTVTVELGPELNNDDICSFGDRSFGDIVTAERVALVLLITWTIQRAHQWRI